MREYTSDTADKIAGAKRQGVEEMFRISLNEFLQLAGAGREDIKRKYGLDLFMDEIKTRFPRLRLNLDKCYVVKTTVAVGERSLVFEQKMREVNEDNWYKPVSSSKVIYLLLDENAKPKDPIPEEIRQMFKEDRPVVA